MRKKFITNLALIISLNLLIKPFWIFGIDRTVQNIVGAHEYGLYFSLFNFSLLLNMLLDLGITNYNNRNISRYNHLLSKSVSNIVGIKFLLAIVYFIVTILVALFLGYEIRQFKILAFLVFNQFIASFILYLRSNLSALQLFKTDGVISVLDRAIMIAICAGLIWGKWIDQPFKIEWFVYTQTIGYIATLLISFLLVYLRADFLKLNFDWNYFRAVLKRSYPFALLTLLMAFYYRVDSVMLERMLENGKEQAGIYAQSFRILDAFTMFAFLFAGLLLPMFSKMIKNKEPVGELTQFSFLLLIVPVISITFSSIFYHDQIIDLLYKEHVSYSSEIFSILIICFIGISTAYIFGTLLTANGNLKELNIMAVSGVLLNVVLNFILIPKYFAWGSAVASLVTQTLTAIIQVVLVFKIFHFKLRVKWIVYFMIYFVGIFLLGRISINWDYNWIYKFIGLNIASIILAFASGLFRIKVLFDILKYE